MTLRARPDANRCFVCGPDNAFGLQIAFRLEQGVCRAEFVPSPHHAGYDGVTHGGIVFSALDDVMANWLFLQGLRAHTARCQIRYRLALPIGERVLLSGRLLRSKGRVAWLEGLAERAADGVLVARATGSFVAREPLQAMPGAGAS